MKQRKVRLAMSEHSSKPHLIGCCEHGIKIDRFCPACEDMLAGPYSQPIHAQAEPKQPEIPPEIDHLLWDTNFWCSMPDARHNGQIVEAYKIGFSAAQQRIRELEAELKMV